MCVHGHTHTHATYILHTHTHTQTHTHTHTHTHAPGTRPPGFPPVEAPSASQSLEVRLWFSLGEYALVEYARRLDFPHSWFSLGEYALVS